MRTLFLPATLTPIDRASAPFFRQRSLYYYARGKMGLDPAYPLLARCLQESGRPILDVGCGPGIFAAYLRESGVTAPVHGVDVIPEKIAQARQFVQPHYRGVSFAVGDAAQVSELMPGGVPWLGDIVLLDVLHYFSDDGRARLLRELVGALAPGARLFLRNGVSDVCGWRHLVTQLEEAWVRSSRWIRGGAWNFPTREAVEADLRGAGARAVVSLPLWGRTPFSSYFFVAAAPED